MSLAKKKGPTFDPGLCRCCGSMKKCRVLNEEYEWSGKKEIYCDMFVDCFGLLLSHMEGKLTERLVCATCVTRLREALTFRKQVLKCEETFLQCKMSDSEDKESKPQIATEHQFHVEIVKMEPDDNEDDQEYHSGDIESDALADSDTDDDIKLENPTEPETEMKPINQIELDEIKVDNQIEPDEIKVDNQIEPDKVELYNQIETDEMKLDILNDNSNSNDDLPLQIVATKMRSEERHKKVRVPKPSFWGKQHKPPEPPKLPISKVQELIREKDQTYMIDTNIINIVEFSYASPFKCRHNNLHCYYCARIFLDPTLLREHTMVHHPKRFKVSDHKNMVKLDLTRIDCRLCSEKIDDLEEFKRHLVSVHGKKYYFDSKDCVLPFRFDKHVIKCALCDAVFPYFHALNKHMNEHYSNYVCDTCGLGFVDRNRFVMHKARHERGTYPCETCGKLFKAEYNRDLHIDRVHKKRGRVYCPKCDVRLMSHPQKQKHLIEVHGIQPDALPCSVCQKVFESRRMLTIHWRKEHLKDFRYECQECGLKFFTRFALNNHMPTHTRDRNFKCNVCEKCYPRLKTLKEHMRIHTNDRRYRCEICGQAFIQNCSLKGHMKSQHPEYG